MASSVESSVSLHQFVKSLESAKKKHSRIPAEFSAEFTDKSAVVDLLLSRWLEEQSMPLKKRAKAVKMVSDRHFLDPFMGLGNLVTAANECGLRAVGVDVNPVAWFWARYQHLNIDSAAFQNAIDRLLQRHTPDGKLLKNLISSLFSVKCPENPAHHAFQHRTFWYKFEQCQNPDCGKSVPLLESFIVLQKRVSIPAYLDYLCPHCERNFDWELKKGVLCQPEQFWVVAPFDSAGIGRENGMWAFGDTRVICPHCKKIVEKNENKRKRVSKKIQLTALLCPFCFRLWQYRGPLPENVRCPDCGSGYNPKDSYVREHNWYRCPDCGALEKIRFGHLKSRPLIYEIYCDECRRDTGGPNLLRDGGGRILSRIEPEDLAQLLRVS
ncbi:hypothetical protein KAH55_08395, partial [bacterium]|nr:hypothetical protein [bacterium]